MALPQGARDCGGSGGAEGGAEADAAGLGQFRLRLEERLQLVPDGAQGFVMHQKGLVDFRQPLENGCVGREVFAHLNECPAPHRRSSLQLVGCSGLSRP